MTAVTDEAHAIGPRPKPLLSPHMRHQHRSCLTTPHPLHLLRSEQGYVQVTHGLVEDGPRVGLEPSLLLGAGGSGTDGPLSRWARAPRDGEQSGGVFIG